MKRKKTFWFALTLSLFLLLSVSGTVYAFNSNSTCNNASQVDSDSQCIEKLYQDIDVTDQTNSDDIFKLKYSFEVTGLSGGVGSSES